MTSAKRSEQVPPRSRLRNSYSTSSRNTDNKAFNPVRRKLVPTQAPQHNPEEDIPKEGKMFADFSDAFPQLNHCKERAFKGGAFYENPFDAK